MYWLWVGLPVLVPRLGCGGYSLIFVRNWSFGYIQDYSFCLKTIRKQRRHKRGQVIFNSVITYLRCSQYPANRTQPILRPPYIENISSFISKIHPALWIKELKRRLKLGGHSRMKLLWLYPSVTSFYYCCHIFFLYLKYELFVFCWCKCFIKDRQTELRLRAWSLLRSLGAK